MYLTTVAAQGKLFHYCLAWHCGNAYTEYYALQYNARISHVIIRRAVFFIYSIAEGLQYYELVCV